MSNIKDGGAAFPCDRSEFFERNEGMTLRDYFAAKALQGLAAHVIGAEKRPGENSADAHARLAYAFADAMLAERNKGGK